MMEIKDIIIKNIRGLQNYTVKLDMIPNKPSLLVGSNGSGKSSLALAFQSLTNGKLNVKMENLYNRDTSLEPEIELKMCVDDTSRVYHANNKINEISREFGVAVINSRIKTEMVKSKVGTDVISQPKLTIDPIVLVSKIPPCVKISYSFEEDYAVRLKQGIVPSINHLLKKNAFLHRFPLDELKCISRPLEKIKGFVEHIKTYSESSERVNDINSQLTTQLLPKFKNISKLGKIIEVIKVFEPNKSELCHYLQAMQLLLLYNKERDKFKQAKEYADYAIQKRSYVDLFKSLKRTWQNIIPGESNGKLCVDIPYVNRLSNGERDIIVFLAMLEKTKLMLVKEYNILIIDDVFDYLDDANLVAVQFYLSSYLAEMKNSNKNIFPIILTHLNPDYYRHYFF